MPPDLITTALGAIINGVFVGGAVWGVLKTEMRFMRRDLDEVRDIVFKERRHGKA